jgi:hypothetical protein
MDPKLKGDHLMDPKLRGDHLMDPGIYEVVHKNWVSEDYLKLKKGPFFIKILAEFNEVVGTTSWGVPSLPPPHF